MTLSIKRTHNTPSAEPDLSFLRDHASTVAPRLLGSMLERVIDGEAVRVRIVEVEAYDQTDAASHSYRGLTDRNRVMFGAAGYLYVYFTYGMHYCCNIVTGEPGHGSAVLLRAVEPIDGEGVMIARRNGRTGTDITNGPAKLCQALDVDRSLNGHNLRTEPFKLILTAPLPSAAIVQTTRVGISRAVDTPWRFYIKENPFVSKQ